MRVIAYNLFWFYKYNSIILYNLLFYEKFHHKQKQTEIQIPVMNFVFWLEMTDI